MADYPTWNYYPLSKKPPTWVHEFVSIVNAARLSIDSSKVADLTSDVVLSHLASGLAFVESYGRDGQDRDTKGTTAGAIWREWARTGSHMK